MATSNPFRIAGELLPEEMIDRNAETARLRTLAEGGHASRLVAPRRYGKTSLLRRVLVEASGSGWACATEGSASPTTVAPVNAAIASVFDRRLRCSVIASG